MARPKYVRFWTDQADEEIERRLSDPAATYDGRSVWGCDEGFETLGDAGDGCGIVVGVVLDA